MKKLITIFILLILVSGCSKKETKPIEKEVEEPKEEIKYIDENNATIGIYQEKGNRIELVKEYKSTIKTSVDIGVFQIYPSNEETVLTNGQFGVAYYNAWSQTNNLKVGFNLKYTLVNGEEVSQNVLDPSMTTNNQYIYVYLYDDYLNRNSSWYSHIEEDEYNDSSLFTSVKLYGATADEINSKIVLTVFTYDGLDDFDESGEYRGNSRYSIEICDINKNC